MCFSARYNLACKTADLMVTKINFSRYKVNKLVQKCKKKVKIRLGAVSVFFWFSAARGYLRVLRVLLDGPRKKRDCS